jgi:two-component system, chemotaxis family, CheB/CheR fusion protein
MAIPSTPGGDRHEPGSLDDPDAASRADSTPAFPVVGVGASAGGLDAFRQLLAHVPANSGLAIVLVQHLDATRASLLSEALAQATDMKVAQAEHGVRIEPNRVYVIPPGAQMAIEQGALKVSPLEENELRPHLPIDYFLRSLAADRGRLAIGVVLSGTASDGTAGLAAIRANGGITFAQDPRSARFGEMPQSAVDAGVVDFCLPLPTLGNELARLARHPYLARSEPVPPTPAGAALLGEVVALVQAATGVDFSEYKPATLKRRLARRMAVRKVQDVGAYLEVLRHHPAEVRSLHEDLLIKVTSFFRNPECFDQLKAIALPGILKHKPPGAPIRAWVVGCATGEEVYSLAISIIEFLGTDPSTHPVLIFGSDLSEKAIEEARAGLYADSDARVLGEERLQRFFVRTERGWRVRQAVRELCVFVRHDVARDPPFSRIDLVSCRNVLIYFGNTLQRRVLAAAHYALNQPGYLLLGTSESASGVPKWFAPAGPGGMLFVRKSGPSTFRFAPRSAAFPSFNPPSVSDDLVPPRTHGALARQVDDLVLARYGPPGVVVNERLEVVQFRGRTGPYLEQPQGEPQSLLLKMARSGLAGPLRFLLAQARKASAPVRRERVTVDVAGHGVVCDLVVIPLGATRGSEGAFVVLFEERAAAPPGARGARRRGKASGPDAESDRGLQDELVATKEHVAALVEEHVRGTDALASANDDLVSSNEELQSLNEELETAKEEVQATNEELATLNDELHDRNLELLRVNADVLNLLDAVEIPILIIDEERRIRRFTQRASTFLGLTQADVGKRVSELILPIQAPDLKQWITRAMDQSTLVEAEVHDHADRWHRLQIRPRRGPGGNTEGAILSLVDIDELRHEVAIAQWARDYARSIVEAVSVPLVVLDAGFCVLSANAAYYSLFGEKASETEGHRFFELGGGEWNKAELQRAVTASLGTEGVIRAQELVRESPGAPRRVTSVSGCTVASPAGEPMVLLAIEDVTERRRDEQRRAELLAIAEEALRAAARADQAKDVFLANLSHELCTPLTSILLHAQALQRNHLDAPSVASAAASIEFNTRRQQKLVEDLLDISRIAAGKLNLALEEVDWRNLVLGVVDSMRPTAEAKSVQLLATFDGEPPHCMGDPGRLQQVVENLLGNAVKFTPSHGHVNVRIDAVDGFARLVVSDTGRGIDTTFLPHIFERFAQEESAVGQVPGLGLGLAIAHDLVKLHGGSVSAESPGRDLGSTFTVMLPGKVVPAVGAPGT